MEVAPVTLEITVAPVDLPHAVHILPHQMRQWAGQVDEVQFTLDLHQSRGRYGAGAEERRPQLEMLLDDLCDRWPNAHVREVDYSAAMTAEVGERFFGGLPVPAKHHYGGPIYSYFFGWHAARHDLVFHLDSDMLFGGGSQTWIREAVDLLRERPDVLLCSPLPGPPTADGRLPDRMVARHGQLPSREPHSSLAYGFASCSTRLFLFDRARFVSRLVPVPLERPRLRSQLRARVEGHPRYELPERTITRRMRQMGLRRVDFLGSSPGMWSLHPALRSELFYRELPRLVAQVEAGDMPEAQLGDYDVNDSLIDWTTARAAARGQRWWMRFARQAAARAKR